ncbi:sensor histidine kinase [Fulvivirga lutimaris]|uniref:sensor histidine kinase n=1 Tax=Fulvivirga lutimaris TaxID=1819566 RepID=UPI0012BC906B|nr:histidine kinase [Fulvivirga lutimaris]MTI39853.1 GHKL domain-containing protein [Fulvivirga lutimaris]
MSIKSTFTKHAPQGLFWAGLISVFFIFQQYAEYRMNDYGYEFSWFTVSIKFISFYLIWALFYPFLIILANRYRLTNKAKFKYILALVAAGLGVAFLHRACSILLFNSLYFFKSGNFGGPWQEGVAVQLTIGWFRSFIEYIIIMAIIMAINYYQLYLQKQRDLDSAKLNALKMQLQPHFLFNTLNSIASLIDIDKRNAQKMLSQLGFLLREILENDKQLFIPLSQEIKYVSTYLEIEHTRFQDRMQIDVQIEKEVESSKIPALLLQPLVENAVKHGISKCPDGGEISINARKRDHKVEIIVINDFKKINGNTKDLGYGIGISNIQNRLEQIYGKDFSFDYRIEESKYCSKIIIPFDTYTHD